MTGLRIAVVGAGVAGLTAAWLLQRRHQVWVFEQNQYVGGHTNTVVLPAGPDAGTPVDTGFIVLNDRNYPTFTKLLEQLDVPVRTADMSFGYYDRVSGLCYSGHDANRLFAQRKNLLDPRFLRLVADLLRFNLDRPARPQETLQSYLDRGHYSQFFRHHYLTAIGAAVWSTPSRQMLDFPAANLLAFFKNHGMRSLTDRPVWQTIPGGSQTYVRKMLARLNVTTGVQARVTRLADSVEVQGERFDAVVLAGHADQSLRALNDPSPEERRLLGSWSYHRNHTVLHTDLSLMPPVRRAWASWNFTRQHPDEPAFLSYHMNRLQGLCTHRQYLVTLNRPEPYPEGSVVAEFHYEHPAYTTASVATQPLLKSLNRDRTYFCGSYFGYGFHEDAVKSAVAVAESLGCPL